MNAGNHGIGAPLSRVDGVDKVTGQARYAAEYPIENMLYGVAVVSRIAKGKIVAIDEETARSVPGVVEVMTHANRPKQAWLDHSWKDELGIPGEPFKALHNETVQFAGQPVALVLAESFEAARFAASLVEVSYDAEPHNIDFAKAVDERFTPPMFKRRNSYHAPKSRGDADRAFADAPLKLEGRYELATEHHNPMEMHASTVEWHGDGRITVYDKTQGSQGVQAFLAGAFGLGKKNVRVINHYVGGAFGSGLRPQWQVQLATMAAILTERSVRVVMTRQQMFTHAHRPECSYDIKLGAERDGQLMSMIHDATTSTSRFESNMEDIVVWGMMNYACPNARGAYYIAPRDTYTSADMRAPGAATGMTLFEIALDEMAYKAGIDPLEMRLKNYSDIDAMNGTEFTSKALREAYAEGAARFGWEKRSPQPRSMQEGRELIGWGVATGMWEAMFTKTSASAKLSTDGRLEVACATSDIGTGTYTVMTQVAADTLGLPAERISARLGDSDLPTSPVEGGSWAAASSGAAVQLACRTIGKQLVKAAAKLDGPLKDVKLDDVRFVDGKVRRTDGRGEMDYVEILRASGLERLEAEETAGPGLGDYVSMMRKSRNTHSAIFAEVRVDEALNQVRVTRVVNAVAGGRIINPKTARSQIMGGVVMGIGMALHEETFADTKLGKWINHNYAEYHVPAHADIHDIDVIFVEEHDPEVTPLGVKGLGEIGIVSTAAAVANAIYHATGKRVRSLPITIDKLLGDTQVAEPTTAEAESAAV